MISPAANKSEATKRQRVWNYFLTVIVSAAMGAGVTWLIMSQRTSSSVSSPSVPQIRTTTNVAPDVTGMSTGEAAVALGNFAYDHQRWSEAARRYQEAIASGIDTADVHTDMGNALRFLGQPDRALEQYTIAQKLNPQHENSLFNQISLFIETLNEPARAIPICEEFMRRFPNSDKLPAVREQHAKATNR
jgi:Tetratricopeptide repeat